ncbi:hypothetical protein ACWEPM_06310 [Streptomyces sp. NPDC004244]|uniref:hypothetical protein n=1 Tax=Streptomyces sp. NPDC101206 TaxID=3366128 RepID=UPI00381F60A6
MASAEWTTPGVYAGPGGVLTDAAGTLTGELTVHTTWEQERAHIAVQYSGASEWHFLAGSPVACPSSEASRAVHQRAVEAVRSGGAVPFTPWPTTPVA